MSYNTGYEDDEIYQNIHFTQNISEQMRVPKRIKATGDDFGENELVNNGNGNSNSWNYQETFDMTVPDRIQVIGQDQHLVLSGTRSAPREMLLDNSVLPHQDQGIMRVSTPPRMISLMDHNFPSATDEPERHNNIQNGNGNGEYGPTSFDSLDDRRIASVKTKRFTNSSELLMNTSREGTPPLIAGDGLHSAEEALHLRRQVAKLNRRVLAVEVDNLQRQQREKIVYCLGLAYFLIKAIMWMNRN